MSISSMLSHIAVQHAGARATSSASPPISTPPTSLDDGASVMSDTTKLEHAAELYEEASAAPAPDAQAGTPLSVRDTPNSEGRRPSRSSRKSVTTYNVQILAGTAIHTPTKYLEKHHKNVLHGSLDALAPNGSDGSPAKKKSPRSKLEPNDRIDPVEEQLAAEAAQAVRRRTSSRGTDLRKEALRNLAGVGEAVTNSLAGGRSFVQKALRRSASDSHLKSVASSSSSASSRRPRTAADTADEYETDAMQEQKEFLKPKTKAWLKQGLYVGQHRDFDPRLSETQNRARKRARKQRENLVLPLPMFAGDRLLSEDPRHVHRHFKLPFDTYHPLPRKVKVDGWVKLSKSTVLVFVNQLLFLTRSQIDLLATRQPCGSETSKIHRNAIATLRMDAEKPATIVSWLTNAMAQTVGSNQNNAAIALLQSSSDAVKGTVTIMVWRSWRLKAAGMVSGQ